MKIAAVEYRCKFGVPLSGNNTLGFELTADASASVELDDFFIFDRDERSALDVFGQVLFRHVAAECDRYWLSDDRTAQDRFGRASARLVAQYAAHRDSEPGIYLKERFSIRRAEEFVDAFFDSYATFTELARAGEGVARDFLSLFQRACYDTRKRRRVRVDVASVRQAAREWYSQEKVRNAGEQQAKVLRLIVNEVVGRHRARSFLFDQKVERTEIIRSLFDLRLVHLIRRGFIFDEDEAGRQYNVYTLDYGTYVDALGTERAPRGDFSKDPSEADGSVVVPFHDNRAIKRIILPPDLLKAA